MDNSGNWIVVGSTGVVIAIVIGLHYEVLWACYRLLPGLMRRRRRVLLLVAINLLTHATSICLFAIAYSVLLRFDGLGELTGQPVATLIDYAYYSGMVYTTVGFGDVIPTGPIRFMTGMEALTGLVMITWTASYTFLEMQRDWHPGNSPPGHRR